MHLNWYNICLAYTWPEFDPQHDIKFGTVVHACNPNPEVEVIGSEVQGRGEF